MLSAQLEVKSPEFANDETDKLVQMRDALRPNVRKLELLTTNASKFEHEASKRQYPQAEPNHKDISDFLNSQCPAIANLQSLRSLLTAKSHGRNLVVCIDGTSNQFGQHVELSIRTLSSYTANLKNEQQLTYYDSGIGTYAKPLCKSWTYWKQVMDNKIDLAIAWNFETIVMNAYRWLVENYQPGDRILLFGFSRGAYQVRTIAGMIDKVGLIHKGNERQIPFAYEVYADPMSGAPLSKLETKIHKASRKLSFSRGKTSNINSVQQTQQQPEEQPKAKASAPSLAKRFKDTFSRNIQVHFVGAWDTVSSIGVVRGKNLPGTASQDHICFFRYALALDERRVKFLPEYACGGVPATTNTMLGDVVHWDTFLIFPKKSNMSRGGGNVLNPDMDRSGAPLLWMSYEAISAGLLMKLSNPEWKWDRLGDVNESLTGVWNLFEFMPLKRLSYENSTSTTFRWHRGKGRQIQSGQKVHASVAFSPSEYRPKAALPPDDYPPKWEELIKGRNSVCLSRRMEGLAGNGHIRFVFG
ncbi:hypothetical protein K439DRAFT_1623713 [Ramaria rubella]|nr:hypothetical protein K439DRAFT_1623713 [Ramaria rubella]